MIESHLAKINNKNLGKRIKLDQFLHALLQKVDDDLIQGLRETSLTNEDKKELYRQLYIKKIGKITKDEFTGFVMSSDFFEFRERYHDEVESLQS